MPGGIGYRLRNRVNLCRMYVRVLRVTVKQWASFRIQDYFL